MKSDAQAVIIGGGISGCSLAYHLALKGWTDVVLLEKDVLTSGATTHAAGLVTHFHASPTMMKVRAASIRLYRELAREEGEAAGWSEVGGVRVASSETQLMMLQRRVTASCAKDSNTSGVDAPPHLSPSFPSQEERPSCRT